LFKKQFFEKNASVIWEIKLASPKFDYSSAIDLNKLFKLYWENNNIKAVSNLIDEKYFSWNTNRWKIFKQKYNKPIFFKEFVIDKKQIEHASYYWYDALLLLERVLELERLIWFINYSTIKNIYPIVEIDTEKWLKNVLKISGDLDFWIAINCRNLWNMKIDRSKHFTIYNKFESQLKDKLVFAFSWIDDINQIKEYTWKYNWVLIGTYFMKQIMK
jgi:indole-3-glycerol phosphate synthase